MRIDGISGPPLVTCSRTSQPGPFDRIWQRVTLVTIRAALRQSIIVVQTFCGGAGMSIAAWMIAASLEGSTVTDTQGRPVVTVASAYVHAGQAGTARQDEKMRFLAAVGGRLATWADQGRYAVLTGDLNVAHRVEDLKNWKGNRGKSGFLPEEQAHLDGWIGTHGFVDVHRHLHGPGPGPYTWWSWRGKAFDSDAGWRIDYQLASAPLAATAVRAEVGRAASYAQRWSDHAPVCVTYAL